MSEVVGYTFATFGPRHLAYLAGTVLVWCAVLGLGLASRSPETRRRIVWGLALVSLGQEVLLDILALEAGVWTAEQHLPLHLCSLALVVSAWAVVTRQQLAFEAAYFWGVVAASQALLTPDATRWRQGELDAFFNFLSHGIIVLNVAWLVVVEGMRVRRGAWLRVFLLTNATAAAIGVVDWLTGWNYFFLRRKPGGDSPFLVGEWPWYLLVLEVLAVFLFILVEIPARRRREAQDEAAPREPLPEAA